MLPNDEQNQFRFEDMSPTGRLWLHRQMDGDIVIVVIDEDGRSVSAEFCTPMMGGGQSEETWNALGQLFNAMKADNQKRPQNRKAELVE